jgi:hypothetical protein
LISRDLEGKFAACRLDNFALFQGARIKTKRTGTKNAQQLCFLATLFLGGNIALPRGKIKTIGLKLEAMYYPITLTNGIILIRIRRVFHSGKQSVKINQTIAVWRFFTDCTLTM